VRSIASTDLGKNLVQYIAAGSLGRAVYGAAAVNHVAKLLRSNAITSAVSLAVATAPDAYRAAIISRGLRLQKTRQSMGQASLLAPVDGSPEQQQERRLGAPSRSLALPLVE
jgi:hypothetical protein